jgi:signal transduction histidine kinase
MKLGPRLAIVTTLLMATVFASTTWFAMFLRRLDLERDLEREARMLADVLAAGLEPIVPADAYERLQERVAWAATAPHVQFRLEILRAGTYRSDDRDWLKMIEATTQVGRPFGRLFEDVPAGQRPVYIMAVPLHNALPDNPARQAVAFLGLRRDASYISEDALGTVRRLAPFLLAGTLGFGVVVYFLLAGSVVAPLRRLIDAIDGVAKGDLDRALLPERDDEIGSLATRFNAMTNSLRDARDDESRANADRLHLETRLRHSEKLATIGQLAAEIAHEVGTPLNVISGRARSLARRAAEPPDVQKNADIITEQADRIAKIIRQVLDFSRQNRPTLTQVDVGKVVGEALGFVDETLRKRRIDAHLHAPGDLPRIPGDPDEIQQVCLNLLTNAIQAMPEGGTLGVTVEPVTRRKEGLALAPPAPFLMLEVSDTGAGIPAADRERIFEAFFTTKDTGEGTGLGLAVTKGIVKDHDGWIEVDDRAGGGAVFRVFLPLGQDAPREAGAPGGGAALPN